MKNRELNKVRPIKDLKDMLNSSVELYGDKAAFLSKPKGETAYTPISYKQFKSDVDAMGTVLIDLCLKNKKIALIGENRYEWSISYLSVVNGTGVIVPLDKELPANEIELLLKRSQADAVIYSESIKDKIDPLYEKKSTVLQYFISMDSEENNSNILSFHSLLQKGHELLKEGRREFIDAEINATKMSMLLFTSGTTEAAKAVCYLTKI